MRTPPSVLGRLLCLGATALVSCDDSTGPTTFGWESISAGYDFTCGLDTDGRAFCWGDAGFGKLAGPTFELCPSSPRCATLPIRVDTDLRYSSLSVGGHHSCGLDRLGATHCWGRNNRGQLGDGTRNDRDVPAPIADDRGFTAINAGYEAMCGLTEAAELFCWGATPWEPDQTLVSEELRFVAASPGAGFGCAIATDRTAYCWGRNLFGRLGDGSNIEERDVPGPVAGGLSFLAISVGSDHACGLAVGGATYCWGRNNWGQLGGGTGPSSNVPVGVAGELEFTAIDAGADHTCGLTSGGTAYCWGRNDYGQLGDGTREPRDEPVPVAGGHVFSTLAAGYFHTCGVAEDGRAYCWGRNASGQLGLGMTSAYQLSPEFVAEPR